MCKTCVFRRARGLCNSEVVVEVEGCAAALRGISDAASRMLNNSLRSGQRVLNPAVGGAPEQANAADREPALLSCARVGRFRGHVRGG